LEAFFAGAFSVGFFAELDVAAGAFFAGAFAVGFLAELDVAAGAFLGRDELLRFAFDEATGSASARLDDRFTLLVAMMCSAFR
jgi:hypothetical protein